MLWDRRARICVIQLRIVGRLWMICELGLGAECADVSLSDCRRPGRIGEHVFDVFGSTKKPLLVCGSYYLGPTGMEQITEVGFRCDLNSRLFGCAGVRWSLFKGYGELTI